MTTCEARVGERATEWGFRPLWCNRAIALGSLRDRQGLVRRFCAAPGHREQVIERFGVWEADALTNARARRMLEQGTATFARPRDPEEPFPCLGCGSPDPVRIEGRRCSDCYDFGGAVFA